MKPYPLARSALLLPLFLSLACQSNNNTNPPKSPVAASGTLGTIERLDPALDALLAKDARVEILAKATDWAEGPGWSSAGHFWVFSDVQQKTTAKGAGTDG